MYVQNFYFIKYIYILYNTILQIFIQKQEEELINLKWQMSMLIRKSVKNFNFNDKSMMSDINLRKFLEITLKLHQIFALVDVNFDAVLTSMSSKTNL